MKKIIFLSLIISPFIQLQAQVFEPGIILGLSGSQINGDGYGGYHKLGLIAGGLVSTRISDDWRTQFELYYIKKGSQKNPHPDKGDYESFNLNIKYLEMPVVIRYHHEKFNFETGLYRAKMLSYNVADQYGQTEIYDPPIKDWDFGGLIGFSYQYKERAEFNIRAKTSLIPIRDFNNLDAYTWWWDELFNRGWYNFDLNFSVRWLIVKK